MDRLCKVKNIMKKKFMNNKKKFANHVINMMKLNQVNKIVLITLGNKITMNFKPCKDIILMKEKKCSIDILKCQSKNKITNQVLIQFKRFNYHQTKWYQMTNIIIKTLHQNKVTLQKNMKTWPFLMNKMKFRTITNNYHNRNLKRN